MRDILPDDTQRNEWKEKIQEAFWQRIKSEYRKEIEDGKLSLSALTDDKVKKLLDLDNPEKTILHFDYIVTHLNKTLRVPEWKEDKNPLGSIIIPYIEKQMQHDP